MPTFKRILCPVDFSEPAHLGLSTAVELAKCFSAELLVVHVVPPVPVAAVPEPVPTFDVLTYERELTKSAEKEVERIIRDHVPDGIRSRPKILEGDPAREIVRFAETERVDLIVMATHGESGWHRFVFGSVTERVVRIAHCPVLTVPEPPRVQAA
jgi:nucleotide-binding universal stress UspA family protein